MNDGCYLMRQQRRHSITYLVVLLSPWTLKKVIVWKRLQSCSLSNGKAPSLFRIRMNVVVPVFGDVARDRCGRAPEHLNPEAISKWDGFTFVRMNIFMSGEQGFWEIMDRGAASILGCNSSSKRITRNIAVHMRA